MRRWGCLVLVILLVAGCRSAGTFSASPTTTEPLRPLEFCAAFQALLANREVGRRTAAEAEWDNAIRIASRLAESAPFELGEDVGRFTDFLRERKALAASYGFVPPDEMAPDDRREFELASRSLIQRNGQVIDWATVTCDIGG